LKQHLTVTTDRVAPEFGAVLLEGMRLRFAGSVPNWPSVPDRLLPSTLSVSTFSPQARKAIRLNGC
jgi:hypothetical protein